MFLGDCSASFLATPRNECSIVAGSYGNSKAQKNRSIRFGFYLLNNINIHHPSVPAFFG
jgi:hypothetical protein